MRSITIPAAGETREFDNIKKGLSLFIIQAPPVENVFEDAASFSFEDQGVDWPATTGTRAPFGNCSFDSIKITGTAATAGQQLIVNSLPVCVDPFVNLSPEVKKAKSGNTFLKDWTNDTNTVKGFSEIELMDSEGRLPVAVYVEARGADIIYRSNDGGGSDPDPTSPSTAGDSFLLPADTGEQKEIEGIDFILNAKFVNAVDQEEPKMPVWPRY